MNPNMRVNKISSLVDKIVMVLAVIALLGGSISVVPAFGEDHKDYHHEHGHGHDRGWHGGEHHDRDRDRYWREEYAPEQYYPPVYAPEPVIVAPPPPSPGINIIFPIHIH